MHNRKVAVMATGGIDSTVLLYQAVEAGERPHVLTVDYGHPAFSKQLELLQFHTAHLGGLPLTQFPVRYLPWQKKGIGLFLQDYVPQETAPLEDWDKLRYEDFFVEGRNLIMVAYALAWCSAKQVDELRVGYLYGETEWERRRSYKLLTGDNSPQFVDAVNVLTQMGFSHQVRLRAPYYETRWSKTDTIREGRRLGIDLENRTYSCYFLPACGVCDNCLLRAAGLAADPPRP